MNNDKKITTYTGLRMKEVLALLDRQMEANAYKKISGGKGGMLNFTDIKPSYLIETLNLCFGLIGHGWGFDIFNTKITPVSKPPSNIYQVTLSVHSWYMLTDDFKRQLPQTQGSHEEAKLSWAVKGAVTNALGMAWAFAGYQLSVYKGLRSHEKIYHNHQ